MRLPHLNISILQLREKNLKRLLVVKDLNSEWFHWLIQISLYSSTLQKVVVLR